jgi:hypothetical protein
LLANWVYNFGGKPPGWRSSKPPKPIRSKQSRKGKASCK